jgi:hypothetical protein
VVYSDKIATYTISDHTFSCEIVYSELQTYERRQQYSILSGRTKYNGRYIMYAYWSDCFLAMVF